MDLRESAPSPAASRWGWLDVLLGARRGAAARGDREEAVTPAFNAKIRNLCLLLSILVVFNHSASYSPLLGQRPAAPVPVEATGWAISHWETAVEFFLSGSMWRVTNPVFFMASGFLFFFGWRPTLSGLRQKLTRRVFTLVGPFVLWTVLSMTINFIAHAVASFPTYHQEWLAGRLTVSQVITFFLNMPTSSQLWFLRDLILLMAFAVPVLTLLLPGFRGWTLALFLALYFSDLPNPGVDRAGLCFFGIGATLGYLRLEPSFPGPLWRRFTVMIWIGLAGAYTILALLTDWPLRPLFNLLVLTGIAGIWAFYDLLPARAHARLTQLSPYRFFIYMMFDPLLPILQRVLSPWLHATPTASLLCYFLLPVLVVGLCIGIASSLRQRLPRGYAMLTGGR